MNDEITTMHTDVHTTPPRIAVFFFQQKTSGSHVCNSYPSVHYDIPLMVKFEEILAQNAVSEWADKYVRPITVCNSNCYRAQLYWALTISGRCSSGLCAMHRLITMVSNCWLMIYKKKWVTGTRLLRLNVVRVSSRSKARSLKLVNNASIDYVRIVFLFCLVFGTNKFVDSLLFLATGDCFGLFRAAPYVFLRIVILYYCS